MHFVGESLEEDEVCTGPVHNNEDISIIITASHDNEIKRESHHYK